MERVTCIPLFKVYMSTGHDTVTISQHMNLDGYAHMDCFEKFVFKFNDPNSPLIAIADSKADAFANGGEAPAEVVEQDDNDL